MTGRLRYGPLCATLPPMSSHAIVAFHGPVRQLSGRIGDNSRVGRTLPGSLSLIPVGHGGWLALDGPVEATHLYLEDARLQSTARRLTGGRVPLLARIACSDQSAFAILELLKQEAALEDPSSNLFKQQAIELLCVQLIRAHAAQRVVTSRPRRRGLADWQVKRVADYMREHLDEDVGLGTLAALVRLSRFHFCTAFRQATGRTPHEWLVAERMARARQLLGDPLLRVTEIALAVGYETPSSFAAAFKKSVGMSPSQFRLCL